jgi:hypothetical protein
MIKHEAGAARRMLTIAASALFLLLALAPLFADVPVRHEEFVYTLVAFNGKDYSGTFVRQESGTLYLISGTDNFVSGRKTLVYFWPLTSDYRLDTDTLNHQFNGTLKVDGNGVHETLKPEAYTYYNLRGEYELNWKVAKGPEALKVYGDFQKLTMQYMKQQEGYQLAQSEYQQKLDNLAGEIGKVRQAGGDVSALLAEFRAIKKPVQPAAPDTYAVPPAQIQEAFILNLKPGSYEISFINPDGSVMQGSHKRVIVFARRASLKVGYDVIPGDKWTRPESSNLPASVLYVSGSTDLYLRPFFEAEYNDLYYQKLVNNDARGNANITEWVKLQQVPKAAIAVKGPGAATVQREESFMVQQAQGSALGYTIVPWNAADAQPGTKPDLIAYHIPIAPGARVVHLSARDEHGAPLPGSGREIRVISGPGPEGLLVALILLPLIVMAAVIVLRRRRYDR